MSGPAAPLPGGRGAAGSPARGNPAVAVAVVCVLALAVAFAAFAVFGHGFAPARFSGADEE